MCFLICHSIHVVLLFCARIVYLGLKDQLRVLDTPCSKPVHCDLPYFPVFLRALVIGLNWLELLLLFIAVRHRYTRVQLRALALAATVLGRGCR
jgi:hypothetical protein